ncbi:MAG: ROK family protein [Verrucomicrobiota bacterium]|nr:ROK family protein [Verrucomicrobiota bacterium]
MYRIGIDLGGTKTEGVVLDETGRELARKRAPTDQAKGYDGILRAIQALHDELDAQTGRKPHTFGIGTPGGTSRRTGLLTLSNTQCLNNRPMKSDLERLLGRPLGFENDANCFAMAEAMLGAGKGKELVFGVIMGTGCGGGIVFKGQVLDGLHFRGGEWGHMSIDPNGPPCFCGRRGCVERFISGGGVQERYAERFGVQRSFRDIEKDYERGEPRAREIVQAFFVNFGRAMANLITILDPDMIVLGGGVSKFEALYIEGAKAVARNILGDELTTPIVKHALGDSAGVLGAALIGV